MSSDKPPKKPAPIDLLQFGSDHVKVRKILRKASLANQEVNLETLKVLYGKGKSK